MVFCGDNGMNGVVVNAIIVYGDEIPTMQDINVLIY